MKLKVLLTYFILSYGLFFYAYKFSQPDIQGLKDYEQYQLMYNGWNFNEVESPFNTRIISTYGIYLLNNLDLLASFGHKKDLQYFHLEEFLK